MKRFLMALGGLAIIASAATAHDTVTAFETRGECEAALARINKEDADFLLDIGEYDKRADAIRWFHESFECQQRDGAWYITFVGQF